MLALQVIYGGGIHFSIQEHYRPPTGAAAGVFRKPLGFSWIHGSTVSIVKILYSRCKELIRQHQTYCRFFIATVKHPMSRRQLLKTRCVSCSYFPFPQRQTGLWLQTCPPKKDPVFVQIVDVYPVVGQSLKLRKCNGNAFFLPNTWFFCGCCLSLGQHVLFMTSSNSTKSCFFFDMFVWVSIELTGFPNKNVKSRIGKRKSTSTETTFNSRA